MAKSYAGYFNYDGENLSVEATNEGGECEECGAGGQQFYATGLGGPTRKLCEACARKATGHPAGCSCGSPDCPEWQAAQGVG
jgi:hypothetical protein